MQLKLACPLLLFDMLNMRQAINVSKSSIDQRVYSLKDVARGIVNKFAALTLERRAIQELESAPSERE